MANPSGKNFKRGVLNIIVGFASQAIILVLGLIIPRMFIVGYGSEVNGLFGTLNQIFAYFTLFEMGLSGSLSQALYKPIAAGDRGAVNRVLSASNQFYKKISLWYLLGVLAMAAIFPLLAKTSIDRLTIAGMIVLQGASGALGMRFKSAREQYLRTEGREYIVATFNLSFYLMMNASKIVLILLKADIVWIQVGYFVANAVYVGLFVLYVRRKLRWIDFRAEPDSTALAQRGSHVAHQVGGLVFNCTDTITISIFGAGLSMASVYAVYSMVMTALTSLVSTVCSGITFMLGRTFHQDRAAYIRLHDAYHTYYTTLVFALMTVCYFLMIPFVALYTSDADINYIYPGLPLMFCVIQLLSAARSAALNLIHVAVHTKQTTRHALAEAVINVTISVIAVQFIGIYGVLAGTIAALLYRSNRAIIYADHVILERSCRKSYRPLLVNGAVFTLLALGFSRVQFGVTTFAMFFVEAVVMTVAVLLIYITVISLCCREEFRFVYAIVKKNVSARLKKA